MKSLLLTLGHNSSAILIEDGLIRWGYETERVTGVKSDSRFPRPVLDKYLKEPVDMVYVSHWSPDGQLSSMSAKHWDPAYFDSIPIRTLSPDRTHHDAHMAAAVSYAGPNFPRHKAFGLVIDGFGNYGEHFSVYDLSGENPKLIQRIRGYDTSLGLWYQYATAFLGMKMNEDEYKLLGYEVHVFDQPTLTRLNADADVAASEWLDRMEKSPYRSMYDPLYSIAALLNVKFMVFHHLTNVCKRYGVEDPGSFDGRSLLAYYVQAVLERVVISKVNALGARHLLVSGGVFYNVKLNKLLIDKIEGQFCAYPLAGDQGAAIGLYAMDNLFMHPSNFNWGVRELKDVGEVKGLHVVDSVTAYDMVRSKLKEVGYVNLVRGNMEFGPRALCNTSTLALPTKQSVAAINEANDRNTVMPMAPVMTLAMYQKLFENTSRVWRSQSHMICAMEYQEHPRDEWLGIAHEYYEPYHHHTGRPQVVGADDPFMLHLLNWCGHPLINTSFNFHGQPIALGMESIVKNHMMQHQRDPSFTTVVIQNA